MLYLLFTKHKSECIEETFNKGISRYSFIERQSTFQSRGVVIFGIEGKSGSYYGDFSGTIARSIAHFTL